MSWGHDCKCSYCADLGLPDNLAEPPSAQVFVDGILIDDVIYALPGLEGRAVAYSTDAEGKVHYCRGCSRRVCLTQLHGDVTFGASIA